MKVYIKINRYLNGQKWYETPFVNGQKHGIEKWWRDDGSAAYLAKWHQGQVVWQIEFPSEEYIPDDTEVEVFFHPTSELT